MKVYSINHRNFTYTPQSNYFNIGQTQICPQKHNDYFTKTINVPSQKNISFEGLKTKYSLMLRHYIKNKTIKTSIKGSKRPYIHLNKNLEPITNKVKLRVAPFEEIEAFDINPKNSDKYIIFLHGFSQNITNNQPLYEALSKTDYGILALDYRGYGKNPISINTSDKDILEDILAGVKYLKEKKGVKHIGLIGHSFGAYLASKISKEHPFDFQILISPMLSLQFWVENVIKHPKKYKTENFLINHIPQFKAQYKHVFKMQKNIFRNSTPTHIIHSKKDRYIKYQDVDIFAQKLNHFKSYILLEKGGHKMDDTKISAIIDTLTNI